MGFNPLYRIFLSVCLALIALVSGTTALASSFAGYESTTEADLLRLLPNSVPEEQGRIHLMLGRLSMDRNLEAAREHLADAQRLLDSSDLAGRAYLQVSRCWMKLIQSQLAEAQTSCQQGIELALESEDAWALAKAYGVAAVLQYQAGDLDEALRNGRLATDYAQQTKNSTTIGSQLNTMGLILRAQGLYEDGLSHFSEGLETLDLDREVDVELYQVMNFNVGLSHADLGDYQLARDYYQVGLAWAQESNRPAKELTALVYIAIADIELGSPELALASLNRAITREDMRQNEGYLAFAYAVIGDAHARMDNHTQALEAYEQGVALAAGHPNTYEQRRLYAGYANTLFKLGEVERARELLQQAIAQADKEQSFGYLLDSLQVLAQVEEASGNYRASLAAYKRAQQLTQEFQQQIVERELALLRADFELDEKERALEDARQQTIITYGVIIFAVALAFIGYLFVSRRYQKQRAEERAQQATELEHQVAERTLELQEQIQQVTAAENARVTLERQLAEAEKLRILGQLTGGVAHDFNNLLTVIIGAAELVRDDLHQDSRLSGLLDHILTAAASGADITRALMAYARKQPMQLETICLNDFLTGRIPLLARTLGGMIGLELAIKVQDPVEVVLDPSQLTTALLNLAINARDAQTENTTVTITLSVRDQRWAVIEVSDRGIGMTSEQIEHAVEPFFTTKPEQGNGLGLSMVYGFSKQLGGDLEIKSEVGQGTRVAIVLPLASASLAAVHSMGSENAEQHKSAGQNSSGEIGAA